MKSGILVTTKETGQKQLYATLSAFTKKVKLNQQTILNFMCRNKKPFENDLYLIERLTVIR